MKQGFLTVRLIKHSKKTTQSNCWGFILRDIQNLITWSWGTCCSDLNRMIGLEGLHRTIPTSTILQFCNTSLWEHTAQCIYQLILLLLTTLDCGLLCIDKWIKMHDKSVIIAIYISLSMRFISSIRLKIFVSHWSGFFVLKTGTLNFL